ncbi:hypothetical protein P154DRAFT_197520 [Amniculicola lignicola CBS 123094]|uniref:Uncharacterized protein n=1 Tax=Amniculicola lignicola CBS 123094 TaxID=1392246 RepID=A0A6A5WGJ3_9PLEO|nr:hypothetical protein P154DRAFT_197520 [Amniculicola lignicola CBS 123094]
MRASLPAGVGALEKPLHCCPDSLTRAGASLLAACCTLLSARSRAMHSPCRSQTASAQYLTRQQHPTCFRVSNSFSSGCRRASLHRGPRCCACLTNEGGLQVARGRSHGWVIGCLC